VKLIPAIDLKSNKCVRLSKGVDKTSFVYNNNPVEQAKFFEKEGCERIHIIDLDAAFGRTGINRKTILNIRESISIPIELGGGIRKKEDIFYWLEKKIDYVIIGSLAVNASKSIKKIANDFEDKIYISLDQLNNKIMIKGWTQSSNLSVKKIIDIYNKSKIKGFIFTDVSRDGMMNGINVELVNQNLSLTEKQMIVGGGLSNYNDLKKLKKLNKKNLEGVIAGKSFYSGAIEIKKGIEILN
jgi:phosphoribosylformimino-5-aminoimidazole carboxamide ribotide isomerase